ncbi:protein of unknown function [Nitrospina watsonii]|uniref:Uncharacterized protein n=1 Tax=Nitrospina watsonii TaxID=1323948 RepID=A0ABM9H9V4_9BACT|nr:protein of unknown function [Nitrospina watsonii]
MGAILNLSCYHRTQSGGRGPSQNGYCPVVRAMIHGRNSEFILLSPDSVRRAWPVAKWLLPGG